MGELTNPGGGRDTTVLDSEPMPGDGQVPHMSALVHRLYWRLPQVYRTMDGRERQWPLKRWLGGALAVAGELDDHVTAWRGERPVGPDDPAPWGLAADELALWLDERRTVRSTLTDPLTADSRWLPWLAQLVGATLDPAASDAERRDTIRYATSGWRAGTRGAIADAARSALTGSRYARVVPHTQPTGGGGLEPGTIWDITVVTRVSETPDPDAVLGAILRTGVKPAGVRLHHAAYEASWDQIEAVYPTFAEREARTWDELAEAGLAFRPIPGNVLPNPSVETDTTGWAARTNSTFGRVLGGVDGAAMGRVTAIAAGSGGVDLPLAPVAPGAWHVSLSLRADVARVARLVVQWRDAGAVVLDTVTTELGTLPADEWGRAAVVPTAPASTAEARVYVEFDDMAAGEFFDIDAALVRAA